MGAVAAGLALRHKYRKEKYKGEMSMTISAVGYVKQNYESFMTRTEKNKATDSLYERMSRELLANQEETEQEEEKELAESERIKNGQTEVLRGSRLQLHLSGEDKKAPYYHLSNNGMIEYKGVTFFCDTQKNQLQLGDISDEGNCLTIPLEGGGALIVNRDNLDELAKAIGMFSPEDANRIMRAIHQDTKAKQVQAEIEDEENRIGEEIEQNANRIEKE